jgi:membrane protein YdbS with pleckstrin-like domain
MRCRFVRLLTGLSGMPVGRKKLFIKEGGIIIMFKGMPKAFWIGCAITYGWALGFMILEWTIPSFPLYRFLGVPACWVYNALIGCYICPIIVAVYFAYSEEVREQKLAEQKKG